MEACRGDYRPRRPEATALHQAVREGFPAVLEEASSHGGLPRWLVAEVGRYLRCGVLRHGFVHVQCSSCKESLLVAFSCKGRGLCPSCGARRMEETAATCDAVLPEVAYRQWTLSLPWALRWPVVKTLTHALAERALRREARGAAVRWMGATVLLGALFLVGQALEYRHLWQAGLVLGRSAYASTFYAVTGFHGLHVLAGMAVLGVGGVNVARGRWEGSAVETAGLFWHFVGVAWLCVVAAVYLASWRAVGLALGGWVLFFVAHLWRGGAAVRWGLELGLALPGLYSLGMLLEAFWQSGLVSRAMG